MTTTMRHEGLEVLEAGRALKVQTDAPHLVSMGGGRLSTAVTLHPLPEGRVSIGSSPDSDIMVQGTGVERTHCYIENTDGVVTLYPLSDMISLDGLKVMEPTRLTQGCMICIGRSNYMRFNHPAEARLMKSILPNSRISMLPLSLYNGDHYERIGHSLERKPPVAPRKSPRDSWGEISNSSSCNSSGEDCCLLGKVSRTQGICPRHISPKVFPPGSVTVNSPASAVLGHSRTPSILPSSSPAYQNVLNIPISNGIQPKSRSGTPTNNLMINSSPVHLNISPALNGVTSRSQSSTPTPKAIHRLPLGSSRSVTSSPAFDRSVASVNDCLIGSSPSLNVTSTSKHINIPSPAFNRNPPPYANISVRSVTPSPPRTTDGIPVSHRRTLSAGHDRDLISPTPSYGSNCSLNEMNARKEELEHKHKQAQAERLREQETEKQERARLEEILTMCAEYERQNKLPTTPTIQQNRIKTNGSLPRDKRLASPNFFTNDNEKPPDIFTFDPVLSKTSSEASQTTTSNDYEFVNVNSHSPQINTMATSLENMASSQTKTNSDNKLNKIVERDKFILPLEEANRNVNNFKEHNRLNDGEDMPQLLKKIPY